MTGFLPEGTRCTAYWYADRAFMMTGSGDLEFLQCLGLRAWTLARWHGVPPWPKIAEGPHLVWLWPEWVWDIASHQMAEDAARFGDWAMTDEAARQPWQPPGDEPGYGYRAAGGYG